MKPNKLGAFCLRTITTSATDTLRKRAERRTMSSNVPPSFYAPNEWENVVSPPPEDSAQHLHFSDSEEENGIDRTDVEDYSHYSQQMSEIMGEDERNEEGDGSADAERSQILKGMLESDQEDEEEDEGFVYTGVDASDSSVPYGEQLRDILGQEHDEDTKRDSHEAENSLLLGETDARKLSILLDDEPLVCGIYFNTLPISSSKTGTPRRPRRNYY